MPVGIQCLSSEINLLTVDAFRVCATRFFSDWTASSNACFSADHDNWRVATSGLASERSWGGVDTALTRDWIVSASVWRLLRRPWWGESEHLPMLESPIDSLTEKSGQNLKSCFHFSVQCENKKKKNNQTANQNSKKVDVTNAKRG